MDFKWLGQVLYLWKVHRSSKKLGILYEASEWLLVALFLLFALAAVDGAKHNMRNSKKDKLPFYDGWPSFDEDELGYGAPIGTFNTSFLKNKEIWFAADASLTTPLANFTDEFIRHTGIPPFRLRVWNDTQMRRYLDNPVRISDWNNWREWYSIVGKARSAVIIGDQNYTLYVTNYPRHDKFITAQRWEQSPSLARMRDAHLASLQIAVETVISRVASDADTHLALNYTRYPYREPTDIDDAVDTNVLVHLTMPMIGVYAMLVYLTPFVRMVAALKRSELTGLKTFLEVNGVSLPAYYLSFTLISVVPRLIMIAAVSIVTTTFLLPDVSPWGFAFFMTFSLIAIVPFAVFLSVFSNTVIGSWRLSMLLYIFTSTIGWFNASCGSSSVLIQGGCFRFWFTACLFTPATFVTGVTTFAQYQVEKWNYGVPVDDYPPMGYFYAMLVVNGIMYSFLAYWASGVLVERRPIMFPFSLACCRRAQPILREPTDSGIVARNVSVKIGKKTILSDVSLDTPQGSIQALLGHNGAGKTTLLRVMTDSLCCEGEVTLCGLSVKQACRMGFVGYCPQDVLRAEITVLDLLEIVACLKGVPFRETKAYAERAAADVGLYDHRKLVPAALAIGNRRKLGVALAFLGSPRVVILDEPTAGLDTRSRHQVWSLMQRYPQAACVFTTHLLDEASLADTIAIMHEGNLPSDFVGTMSELKSRFNCRQSLDVVKSSMMVPDDNIIGLVAPYVPRGWDPNQNVKKNGRELAIALPDEDGMRRYVELLKIFQDNEKCKAMGIESFSLRMTGLEDVLVRMSDPFSESLILDEIVQDDNEDEELLNISRITRPLLSGKLPPLLTTPSQFVSIPYQMWIVFYHNKVLSTFRSVRYYGVQLVGPIMFIIACLIYTSFVRTNEEDLAEHAILGEHMVADHRGVWFVGGDDAQSLHAMVSRHPIGDSLSAVMLDPFEGFYEYSTPFALENVGTVSETALEVRMWFNASVTTSVPVTVNYLMNVMRGEQGAGAFEATVKSYPVYSYVRKTYLSIYGSCLGLCFSVITAFFAGRLVHERKNGLRHLTQLCGLHDTTFYVAYGLGDFVAALIAELAVMLSFGLWVEAFGRNLYGMILLLLLLYTPTILAMNYTLSYMFHKGLGATIFCTVYHYLIATTLVTLTADHPDVAPTIFRMLSPLAAYVEIIMYFQNHNGRAGDDAITDPDSSQLSLVSNSVAVLMMQLLVWCILLTLAESGYKLKNLVKKIFPRPPGYYEKEAALAGVSQSDTVRKEMREVVNMRPNLDVNDYNSLSVKQLRKVYGKRIAVSGMYLKLEEGTCFGLLSPSGAGKSTAVMMMAGLLPPSQGEVSVRGLSNLYPLELKKLQKLVGYLPQTNPLPPTLTVCEVLKYFALLKGIPGTSADSIQHLLRSVGIEEKLYSTCGSLSGGNKRLVALLLALLGSPPILLLDEPTAAMDPSTREKAWWLITSRANAQVEGPRPIVVVTTNSLKEVDAVCNKVGVMIQGHLSEVGNPKELKERHTKGYYLQLNLVHDKTSMELTEEITARIPGTNVLERHGKKLEFQFPGDVSLPDVIDVVEGDRDQIREYSISKMSFEQTYLHAIEQQRAADIRNGLPDDLMPPLRVCILIVGSRGDVQPFLAFGERLQQAGHTVRIATHECFRSFVTNHGMDFTSIGGDPEKLMQFMVEHPSMITTNLEEIRAKRTMMSEIFSGCWRAASSWSPDVLVANPPVQVHVHIAEALHIPLQIHFTMPWSPTKAYLHPLAVVSALGNEQSYGIVEDLMWLGMSDIINTFRCSIGLRRIRHGSGLANRLKVPHVYCVSECLVPKPADWAGHISVAGFWFLDSLAVNYDPPPDLAAFLAAGPPPVYIGFGSIVVPDTKALEHAIFKALEMLNEESFLPVRAIVSPGWAKLGSSLPQIPSYVYLLDKCPHDWLFPRCSAVVHHGGAGTTAAGLRAGKPTIVIPFFGDQPFWGSCCERQKVGPAPIPHKSLTAKNLAGALREVMKPGMVLCAKELSLMINSEAGVEKGLRAFYNYLPLDASGAWKVQCVENQRWFPVVGWSATLAVGDPTPYSDETGRVSMDREAFPCPEGWVWEDEWAVLKLESADGEGFVYGTSFKGPWRKAAASTDVVRRRTWVRRRARKGVLGGGIDEVTKLRNENRSLKEQIKSQTQYIRRLLSSVASDLTSETSMGSTPEDHTALTSAVRHGCTDVAHILQLYEAEGSSPLPTIPSPRISEMDVDEGSSPGF